ncbi:hypothetical protein THIAE_07275 [Thiomicrospira aerophila AL3]|uniref:Flagellar protein FlaG n=1 Tax=Thiomicrospira aerophila AL3 TaxID=717772 RepID=W0DZB6_9GAMM|nr:flagellar protein FlaG [Thiomicrospira aerophila]AHF02329.1 hypothetical protein THIAE_07275 [Thiomicrospira aerophila AL3]
MDAVTLQPNAFGGTGNSLSSQPAPSNSSSSPERVISPSTNESLVSSASIETQADAFASNESLNSLISQLDSQFSSLGMTVRFGIDEASNRNYIAIEDSVSGDLVRQIPSEEMLSISRNLQQFLESNLYARVGQSEENFAPGLLTDQQV